MICEIVPQRTPSSDIEGQLYCIPPCRVDEGVESEDLTHCTTYDSTSEGDLNCIPPSIIEIAWDARVGIVAPPPIL